MKVPGLDERIDAHAKAVIDGDDGVAEAFVTPGRLDAWRTASAAIRDWRPLRNWELLACAKIGGQFIAKTRFHGANGAATLLLRWRDTDGTWMIADAEDISIKRSPWSDIPHYTKERANA